MGKIKNLLSSQKNSVREVFFRYLITLISAEVFCILFVILEITEYNDRNDAPIEYLFNFLWIFAIGVFLIETFWGRDRKNKDSKKRTLLFVFYEIMAIISAVFTILGMNIYKWADDRGELIFYKIFYFYLIGIAAVSLFYLIRDSRLGFHKYLLSAVFNLILASLVFLTLNLGVFALLGLFDSLIVEIDWEWTYYAEILLAGFVYLPYVLICLSNKKEMTSKFVRGFLLFALMPMVIIAMLIIYLYMIKLLFGGIPSNEIFSYCAWIFVICAPIWTMSYAFLMDKEKLNFFDKAIRYIKYIYAPFLLLECYSIGARIHQWGVTESRYLAVVFILVQLIYILWEPLYLLFASIRKKKENAGYGKNYENLILVLLAVLFIVLLAPGLNINHFPYLSQKARFEKSYEAVQGEKKDDVKEWKRLKGAYEFLDSDYLYGESYLRENYSKEELQEMLAMMEQKGLSDEYDSTWKYKSRYSSINEIEIDGYLRLYLLYSSDSMGERTIEDYQNYEITYGEEQKTLVVDLSGVILQLCEDSSYEEEEYIRVMADDKHMLLITSISFSYQPISEQYRNLYISGYILEK